MQVVVGHTADKGWQPGSAQCLTAAQRPTSSRVSCACKGPPWLPTQGVVAQTADKAPAAFIIMQSALKRSEQLHAHYS